MKLSFLPPMRNKRGKRYGFVRFRNVEDDRLMYVALGNIFIKGCKIYANILRFKRGFDQNKKRFEARNNRNIQG